MVKMNAAATAAADAFAFHFTKKWNASSHFLAVCLCYKWKQMSVLYVCVLYFWRTMACHHMAQIKVCEIVFVSRTYKHTHAHSLTESQKVWHKRLENNMHTNTHKWAHALTRMEERVYKIIINTLSKWHGHLWCSSCIRNWCYCCWTDENDIITNYLSIIILAV